MYIYFQKIKDFATRKSRGKITPEEEKNLLKDVHGFYNMKISRELLQRKKKFFWRILLRENLAGEWRPRKKEFLYLQIFKDLTIRKSRENNARESRISIVTEIQGLCNKKISWEWRLRKLNFHTDVFKDCATINYRENDKWEILLILFKKLVTRKSRENGVRASKIYILKGIQGFCNKKIALQEIKFLYWRKFKNCATIKCTENDARGSNSSDGCSRIL